MEESTNDGEIPAMRGTGALRYSFRVEDKMGIKTCSHLKGNRNEVKA